MGKEVGGGGEEGGREVGVGGGGGAPTYLRHKGARAGGGTL